MTIQFFSSICLLSFQQCSCPVCPQPVPAVSVCPQAWHYWSDWMRKKMRVLGQTFYCDYEGNYKALVLKICLREETLKRALNTNPTFWGTLFMFTWYSADWRLRGPAPPPRSGSRGQRPGPGTSQPRPAGQHAHAHLQLEVFRPGGLSSPRQPAAPPLCPPRPRTWGRPGAATCPVGPWSWSACCSSQPPTATITWGQCLECFREYQIFWEFICILEI